MSDAPKNQIALAADLPLEDAVRLYARLEPFVGWVKVGLSLFVEHGPRAVQAFQHAGARVFLDLKLHDIPHTVELAAARAAALGVGLLTVHAQGGSAMLRAALAGAADGAARAGVPPPRILAVTVLTSLSAPELAQTGVAHTPAEQVERMAQLAVESGVGGLVCSAQEAARLRARWGPELYLCTPGIRPAGAQQGDQARAETPSFALRAGSNLLVVGRPLHQASHPEAAARAVLEEVTAALLG